MHAGGFASIANLPLVETTHFISRTANLKLHCYVLSAIEKAVLLVPKWHASTVVSEKNGTFICDLILEQAS